MLSLENPNKYLKRRKYTNFIQTLPVLKWEYDLTHVVRQKLF